MCKRKEAVDAAKGKPASPAGASVQPCPECPTKVTFTELGTNYGFDDHTSSSVPWKSVEVGKTDTVKATAEPAAKACNVSFKSADTSIVKATPEKAGGAEETVTLEGVAAGKSSAQASCNGTTLGEIKIKTCERLTKTVAIRLVHEKNYKSTDVSDATIETFLKKVYEQAVFEFKLTRLPEMTVEFDKNGDGKIDVDKWMSDEMIVVRDQCKDDGYDYNLFVVNKPSDGSFGFMSFNQKYGFIHADTTTTPEKTVAHELGHGAFGLEHKSSDATNIMRQGEGTTMWRLRFDQWEKINR